MKIDENIFMFSEGSDVTVGDDCTVILDGHSKLQGGKNVKVFITGYMTVVNIKSGHVESNHGGIVNVEDGTHPSIPNCIVFGAEPGFNQEEKQYYGFKLLNLNGKVFVVSKTHKIPITIENIMGVEQ